MDEFPTNAVSHYTTRLRQSIDLDGRWEVALVEASIPTKWSNIMSDNYIRILLEVPIKTKQDGTHVDPVQGESQDSGHRASKFRWVKEKIPDRIYHRPQQLVSALNSTIYMMKDKIYRHTPTWQIRRTKESRYKYFKYDKDTETIATGFDFDIQLSGQLALILGKGNGTQRWVSLQRERDQFHVNLRRGLHHIFVYTDIVDYVYVGDKTAPLLRVIPLANTTNNPDQYTHVFTNVHYIPVSRRNIETIQLDLRTDTGEYVSFLSGPSILKLHFRRRRPL